jgi:hypothetical protein
LRYAAKTARGFADADSVKAAPLQRRIFFSHIISREVKLLRV